MVEFICGFCTCLFFSVWIFQKASNKLDEAIRTFEDAKKCFEQAKVINDNTIKSWVAYDCKGRHIV